MSECKSCGKEIIWGVDAAGIKIPLDPRPQVYMVVEKQNEETRAPITAAYFMDNKGPSRWMVAHKATCPNWKEYPGSVDFYTPPIVVANEGGNSGSR